MDIIEAHEASFRDKSGFIFRYDSDIYRQVSEEFRREFDDYIASGLHQKLVDKGYIVDHQDLMLEGEDLSFKLPKGTYKVLKPEQIPYISYPYEWSFSQLKDAALLTLEIQKLALEYGFTLKDATAFNVQFYKGRPVFIDTLSFKKYNNGPWGAYLQFCKHFLAPLTLKCWSDHRLGRLSELFIDGISLDLASQLLPKRTWFNFNILSHIHLHARFQGHYALKPRSKVASNAKSNSKITKRKLSALIDSLIKFINDIKCVNTPSEWSHYYDNNNYERLAMEAKESMLDTALSSLSMPIGSIADVGANSGNFSKIAAKYSKVVLAFDMDENAVEQHYACLKKESSVGIYPLVLDLFNPSPAIGWHNKERASFVQRGQFNVVIALALIHHLAITNNVPLNRIIELFHNLALDYLILEFVPKNDSQVQHLLATREDIFPNYNEPAFEEALLGKFEVVSKGAIPHSERVLYCLRRL
ncbi:hypothetical protein L4D20_14400 [Vibrio kyushuensis]|uniref:hypothetical protein n=1 Tax=Vibrio kyushuensis TaxID=2910249 RepID=UPI003D1473A0